MKRLCQTTPLDLSNNERHDVRLSEMNLSTKEIATASEYLRPVETILRYRLRKVRSERRQRLVDYLG